MSKTDLITVEELAAFMNLGWPGEDWCLDARQDWLWERTFTFGRESVVYEPRQAGQLINLYDYEADIVWQGVGSDPTRGRGYTVTELFHKWQERSRRLTLVIAMPPGKANELITLLEQAGCMVWDATGAPRGDSPPVDAPGLVLSANARA